MKTTTYDKAKAEEYLDRLLKEHKIKIYGYATTSSGRANWKTRSIKIPSQPMLIVSVFAFMR